MRAGPRGVVPHAPVPAGGPSMPTPAASADRLRQVRAVFESVIAQPADEWPSLVELATRHEPDLTHDVMRLLRASHQDRFHLDTPQLSLGGDVEPAIGQQQVGRVISRYKLVRLVGYGGMGAVYEGVRADDEYQQRVAIKLIRAEFVGSRLASRLRRERQILAALEHRNIARLVDGGATESGEPYFVMEFVEGTPITRYCDEHRLSVTQRLRLFLQACAAVVYAHGKLVIHRDLKPANVLVTADGSVKLLDFGIATLLSPPELDTPGAVETLTQSGHPLTPEYASPEQLRDEPASVSSDVYSLGVVLYELLAGRRPFDVRPRTAAAALRALEGNTPAPSQAIAATAAERAGESGPERLRQRLVGELDNVVRKAIRSEPARRYQSVEQLAADLQAHLNGFPVSAQPDTHGYRARKFILRHVPAVTAACVATLAMIIGTTAALIQARRADAERAEAVRVSAFLQATLSAPDARTSDTPNDSGAQATVSGLLRNATRRADIDLATDPAVQAIVLHTLGNTYTAVGEYDKGVTQLTRSLAIDRKTNAPAFPDIARDLVDLGDAQLERGDNVAADSLFRGAVSLCRGTQRIADSALVCVAAIHDLGAVTWFEDRLVESEQLLTRAAALFQQRLGPSAPLTAIALGNLGGVRDSRGDIVGAQRLYRQSLAAYRTSQDSALPERAFTLTNLAASMEEQGRDSEAVPLVREAIAVISRAQSPTHPDAAVAWIQLGALHRELGDIQLARAETGRGLSYLAAAPPISRRLRARVMTSEGLLLLAEQKPAAARATLEAALDTAAAEFDARDPRLADVQDALGLALLATHHDRDAEAMLLRSYETFEHAWGIAHPRTLEVATHLASARSHRSRR